MISKIKRTRFNFVNWFAIAAVVAFGTLWIARAPIRNAAKIRSGDRAERVRQLLGEPQLVFLITSELQRSYLEPMSYVFTDSAGRSGITVDRLPPVDQRAEWYEYASAGHLVYYDEHGVTEVLWGGT